jgi:hypothetical protein
VGNPRDHRTDDDVPTMPGEAQLLSVMEQSDRDLAAGQTVPLPDALAELDEVATGIEVCRSVRRA